jgi:hypothetical protein
MGGVFGKINDQLFGGPKVDEKALKRYRPTMMSGGGFQSTLAGPKGRETLSLTSDANRQAAISNVQGALMGGADMLAGQRGLVRPGFGALTEARVGSIDTARRRATGTLRDNLSRRRVLGSSFAADAMGRVESEFGRQEAEARAQSFLEELQMTTGLIEREAQYRTTAMTTALDNLNLEASLATQLATGASAALLQSASMQAQIAQMKSQQTQEFFQWNVEMAMDSMGMFMGGGMASDRRLKRNIEKIGELGGHNVYSFEYIWGERAIGFMADEVPHAIAGYINGFAFIDLGRVL